MVCDALGATVSLTTIQGWSAVQWPPPYTSRIGKDGVQHHATRSIHGLRVPFHNHACEPRKSLLSHEAQLASDKGNASEADVPHGTKGHLSMRATAR